jgi:F-type H+/Na+-transporting ATPase subunit alpha
MPDQNLPLQNVLDTTFNVVEKFVANYEPSLKFHEIGIVKSLGNGIALIEGLPGVKADELVRFPGNLWGMAFNLDPQEVGVILLGASDNLKAGDKVRRTGRVLDVPVGFGLVGRVVTPLGKPLDNMGKVETQTRLSAERPAKGIMARSPVTVPLQTGIKVIDALIPIGRGQRELILGDRQTGKTAIALDTMINQKGKNILCIYCAIGQRSAAIAKLIADLKHYGCMDYCTVVVTTGDDAPGLQYIAPYAATSMGEYWMEEGKDVLIIYDDLTSHARSYRELCLLLRRPPGREAYPGDIFYIHSRLLERSTHLKDELGGGSLTSLPIVETQAQNLSAYIPTNLISITDGQIYLSPDLFQKGILPAVEVGRSVSRVGGKTQLRAYRHVAGALRLSYSQFQELEVFARFGTRLDEATQQILARGQRVREVFKQDQYQPLSAAAQIAVLFALNQGIFDAVPLSKIKEAQYLIMKEFQAKLPEIEQSIEADHPFHPQDQATLFKLCQEVINDLLN